MPLASPSTSLIHRLSLTLWGLFLTLLLLLSVLGYAALDEDQMVEGVRTLSRVMDRSLTHRRYTRRWEAEA